MPRAKGSPPKLEDFITVPTIAKEIGRPRQTVLRWLRAMNEEQGGKLLRRHGKVYVTTWARLRQIAPDMVPNSPTTDEQMARATREIAELRRTVQALAGRVRMLEASQNPRRLTGVLP